MNRIPAPHAFGRTPQATIERSKIDRSHGYQTTFDADYLIPMFVDDVLPGDTLHLNMRFLARLSTQLKPIMDHLNIESQFFFVPNRLVWANFVKMMGEQTNPADSISYTFPTIANPAGGWVAGTLGNYFGLPRYNATMNVVSLPFRAYNLIWNQWYRDENLQNSVTTSVADASDNPSNYVLLKRGKKHDYFTSCLPWPQKGATAVSLPLGTSAPVVPTSIHAIPQFWNSIANSNAGQLERSAAGAGTAVNIDAGGNSAGEGLGWNIVNLQADLSTATAATINQLRQAFQIQKLLERDARGGTRYTEIVRSHFGVVSPDARLQRPEYLGGGSTPVIVSPIAQTSTAAGATAAQQQANLAGMGTAAANRGHGFSKSITEHGYVIGLISAVAPLRYSQGIERHWSRATRYDVFWPTLAHIGEQAVLNKEIFARGDANDNLVFGYQGRYDEYRYKPPLAHAPNQHAP